MSEEDPIRVVLVDDHSLIREGIRSILSMYAGIDVVAEAADGEEAMNVVANSKPDVVLMDINMPRMNGIEATRQILSKQPSTRVIALTVHDDETLAEAMRVAGASGFLTKGARSEALISAIRGSLGR